MIYYCWRIVIEPLQKARSDKSENNCGSPRAKMSGPALGKTGPLGSIEVTSGVG